jgi:hypothetical protein
VTHSLGIAGTVIGLVAAALVVAGALTTWYRTVGRRRDHYSRLSRLGANAQVSFFEAVLGQPPALKKSVQGVVTTTEEDAGRTDTEAAYRGNVALFYNEGVQDEPDREPIALARTPVELSERVWVDRDYYVQAVVDADGSVLAYSVTTRSKRFHPTFYGPSRPPLRARVAARLRRLSTVHGALFTVRLGQTTFGQLPEPRSGYAAMGFHRYVYTEAHWFGNPGCYKYFVFSSNDAGAMSWSGLDQLFPDGIHGFRWSPGEDVPDAHRDALERYRAITPVNTYTVIGPRFHLEDYPISFGPELNEVRTLG